MVAQSGQHLTDASCMNEMLLLVCGARRGRGVLTGGIMEDMRVVGKHDNEHFCYHATASKA